MNAGVHGFLPGPSAYGVAPGRVRRLAVRPNVLEIAESVLVVCMRFHPGKCPLGQVKRPSVFGRAVTSRQSINPEGMTIHLFGGIGGLPVILNGPEESSALLVPHVLLQKSSAPAGHGQV